MHRQEILSKVYVPENDEFAPFGLEQIQHLCRYLAWDAALSAITSRGGGEWEPHMLFVACTSILARASTGRASRIRLHPSREEEILLHSRDAGRRHHYQFEIWIAFSAQLRHGVRWDTIFAEPRRHEKYNSLARSWKKPFARQRQTQERLAA